MTISRPRRSRRLVLAAAGATLALAAPAMADSELYTQTNDPAGNVVQQFDRADDGRLLAGKSIETGGLGSAAIGGRQGAVATSDDGDTIYAINAGSDTVTSLQDRRRLRVTDTTPSGGSQPVSVDEQDGRVYVLNSGGVPNVTSFRADGKGRLYRIPGGSQELPGAVGAAQVSVTPDGGTLVVSERLSNRLETISVARSGRLGEPVITASSGAVPFGFAITHAGDIVVSEAGASSVSSYRLGDGGALSAVSASLLVGQGAACWVAVTPDGSFAYTGNASGSISGYSIDDDGALHALNANGLTAAVIPSPRDLAIDSSGRFLYAVSPGNATAPAQVTGYRIGADGSLEQFTSQPAAAGLTGAAIS